MIVVGTPLEAVFWFSALLGGTFLVLATVFGGHGMLGHVHLPHVHVPHLHVGAPHATPSDGTTSVTPIILGFVSLFGLGGLLALNELGITGIAALAVGLAFGVIGGVIAYVLFAFLQSFEAREPTALAALPGRDAQVAVPMSNGRVGQVKLLVDGAVRSFTAISSDDLRTGEHAQIVAIDGVRLVVRRPRV